MELGQNRRDFLRCRRTKDIADQYDECQTLSAGKILHAVDFLCTFVAISISFRSKIGFHSRL